MLILNSHPNKTTSFLSDILLNQNTFKEIFKDLDKL